MNTYQKDYQLSRKEELRFERFLHDNWNVITETTPEDQYCPDWDLSVTSCTSNHITTFEVKYNDNYKEPTVVIEDSQFKNGKLIQSGLSKTKADHYIFTFKNDNNFYSIPVSSLKQILYDIRNIYKRTVFDKNGFRLFIVQKDYFLKQCKVFKP